VDEKVVVDQGLITSRRPEDLPAFCALLVDEFANPERRTRRYKPMDNSSRGLI
jgi:putative intracellular protease/amidase